MASSEKPWERSSLQNSRRYVPQTPQLSNTKYQNINPHDCLPPPIPKRNMHSSPSFPMGTTGYNGGFNPYSFGGLAGSGIYNGAYGRPGGYGYGPGSMGAFGQSSLNSFSQLAENSTRPAFESLEGIVSTFSSITMMLESTYFAVHSSFRAVVGLADHFSNLKHRLSETASNISIIRTLKYIVKRILILLRLRTEMQDNDEAWSDAVNKGLSSSYSKKEQKSNSSSWPVLLFFAIIIGGPYLIWKLISSVSQEREEESEWLNCNEDHFIARAEYDFNGESNDELSFTAGQEIIVAPKELQPRIKGWLLACVDGQKQGLIPGNYVRVLGKRRGRRIQEPGPKVQDKQPDLEKDIEELKTVKVVTPSSNSEIDSNFVINEQKDKEVEIADVDSHQSFETCWSQMEPATSDNTPFNAADNCCPDEQPTCTATNHKPSESVRETS